MLFNSFQFAIFLPIVFLLYWLLAPYRRWQNLLIIVASYVFYGWWIWRLLLLIALTSFCSYVAGLLIEHYEGRRRMQQVVSATNIAVNLTVLGVFKYYNFFVENLDALLSAMGWHLDWVTMNFILPVGISFYTFQALSYSIDVYQKKLSATHDIVEFFAYISFFPQLVAGPIERATNLLPQFRHSRTFDYAKAVDGLRQMLWGFFKKLVIADNCATVVNEYWGQYSELSGWSLFLLGVFFAIQIYSDFSGYSDIAIGCARLFGLHGSAIMSTSPWAVADVINGKLYVMFMLFGGLAVYGMVPTGRLCVGGYSMPLYLLFIICLVSTRNTNTLLRITDGYLTSRKSCKWH